MDTVEVKANQDKLAYARPQYLKHMITYYYDMGNSLVYKSDTQIDYRMLTKCERCLRIEFGNVQVLKDQCNEWRDYPIDDRELSWIMLKAKNIPRAWDLK